MAMVWRSVAGFAPLLCICTSSYVIRVESAVLAMAMPREYQKFANLEDTSLCAVANLVIRKSMSR